ncbi:hypothetical protein V6N13_122685 [Hibiscus sabdariffa]
MDPVIGASKSSFISGANLFMLMKSRSRKPTTRKCFKSPMVKSIDHIPRQFRQQNLIIGTFSNSETSNKQGRSDSSIT